MRQPAYNNKYNISILNNEIHKKTKKFWNEKHPKL